MANPEHLAKLKEGVEAWNTWRKERPGIVPNLEGAELERVNLQGVSFWKVNLKDADFLEANLKGANFRAANLESASLWEANLEGADFHGANLKAASLWGANLEGANFYEANLQGTYLASANLESANLVEANLEGSNVTGVKFNRRAGYRGIRVATCYGSPRFKRFAQDQDFLEEFRSVWWRRPIYWLWLIFADCGRSLWPWLCWSIAMAIGFGVKFYSMGESAFCIKNLDYSLSSMIYYSVVTFTTLGFGDITPQSHEAARWVMAEVITGYIMLGGLISIFATKLARRS